jgi:hypothetical protein
MEEGNLSPYWEGPLPPHQGYEVLPNIHPVIHTRVLLRRTFQFTIPFLKWLPPGLTNMRVMIENDNSKRTADEFQCNKNVVYPESSLALDTSGT